MTDFKGKIVPTFDKVEDLKTQDDFCNLSSCQEEELDCGECLFSSTFCSKAIFKEWKDSYTLLIESENNE